MLRIALHCLLILALLLNGSVPAWAQHVQAVAAEDTSTHCDGHGMTGQDPPVSRDQSSGEVPASCCDPQSCECGCTLPPAISVAMLVLRPQGLAHISVAPVIAGLRPAHGVPPDRPPA